LRAAKYIDFVYTELSPDLKNLQVIVYWTDSENVTHEKRLQMKIYGYTIPEDDLNKESCDSLLQKN
jgi:hypothetical protein